MSKLTASDFGALLPPELEDHVLREVEPGETVAWVGRPLGRRLALSTLPIVLFAIPWTAFAVFWVVMASAMGRQAAGGPPGFDTLFPLFGVPFIVVGFGLLSSPFRAARRARRMAYVVTDRRVIFLEPSFPAGRKVVSLRPSEFGPIERVERDDGSGDLTFGVPLVAQARPGTTAVVRRFVGIPQAREVESLIRRTLLAKGDAPA